ncbi:MAG: C45 family autoproteolytic acyltransferase/hydrolase [Candidatus Aminicenantes bacterium]|nr:C45 family autoproteolytic acyltransferase/hydrolase [Candidatus Aminicenantes bacterium]
MRSAAITVICLLAVLVPLAGQAQTPAADGKLRIVTLEGTPYQMGLAHGTALKAEIAELVKRWKEDLTNSYKMPADEFIRKFLAYTDFKPAIERWTPGLLEEVRGIAAGAGVDFDTMYAFQLIDEVWVMNRDIGLDKCTSIAAGKRAEFPAFVSQTQDIPGFYHGFQTVLRIKDKKENLETLVFTIPGVIALNGMNSRSVGVCVNAVPQLACSPRGLPVAFVIRGLLRQRTYGEAAKFLGDIPPAAPQNYMIGGSTEAACFERSAGRMSRFIPFEGSEFTYHTNHPIVNEDFTPRFAEMLKRQGTTLAQYGKFCTRLAFLGRKLTDKSAVLDLDQLKALYSNHASGINNAGTYGCTIMILGEKPELHISPGRPDVAPFQVLGFSEVQGKYFAKKAYAPSPLPTFAATKTLLPSPRFDDQPGYVAMYWKAWELAFRNFHEPAAATGYVSQFIDAAFNQNIFAWDTCFMTFFTNTAHPLVPGIASLDNFYARQHEDGEICREIDRSTGRDFKVWINPGQPLYSAWGFNIDNPPPPVTVQYIGRQAPLIPSKVTLDGLDHPLFAWAEIVDISCEMVLVAREMAEMARTIGKRGEAEVFDREADALAELINRLMWDPDELFYYDLKLDGTRAPIKSVAGFWALLAGVADGSRAAHLAAELDKPATFGRLHPVPTVAADQPLYNPKGEYWRGSAWAPTTTMVVRGLEKAGYHRAARSLARNDLDVTYQVFAKTGTVWENYAPDAAEPGNQAKKDFVGWSGIGPILYLLEFGLGLKPDAPANTLTWDIQAHKRLGCERYRFNGHVVDLDAVPAADGSRWSLTVRSDGEFILKVSASSADRTFAVKKGQNEFVI